VLGRQAADLLERKQREEKYLAQLQQDVHERTLELKESKDLLQNIAEIIPDIISVQGYPSRNVIYHNREAYSLSGLSAEDLSKMTIEERHKLVHPDDLPNMKKYVESLATMSDKDLATFEYRVKNKLKDWIWLRTRGKVFERDEKNNVISIVNVIQNISAEKEREQEIVKSLALLQQSEEIAETGTWEYDITTRQFNWSDGIGCLKRWSGTAVGPGIYHDYVVDEDQEKRSGC
jgi:PAS domain S-box-containing protein